MDILSNTAIKSAGAGILAQASGNGPVVGRFLAISDLPTIPACRVSNSASFLAVYAVQFPLTFDQEAYDTDSMHYTSNANLTGTVSNSAGSVIVSGSGTLFTSELVVGQVIRIPNTSSGLPAVVVGITSNTSLTVNKPIVAANAAGTVAQCWSGGIVARTPGKYHVFAGVRYGAHPDGYRQMAFTKNRGMGAANGERAFVLAGPAPAGGGQPTDMIGSSDINANQWDVFEVLLYQTNSTLADLSIANLSSGTADLSPIFGATWQGS